MTNHVCSKELIPFTPVSTLSGGGRGDIITDSEFEGVPLKDLADGSLQAWVHHSQAILPQVCIRFKNNLIRKISENK